MSMIVDKVIWEQRTADHVHLQNIFKALENEQSTTIRHDGIPLGYAIPTKLMRILNEWQDIQTWIHNEEPDERDRELVYINFFENPGGFAEWRQTQEYRYCPQCRDAFALSGVDIKVDQFHTAVSDNTGGLMIRMSESTVAYFCRCCGHELSEPEIAAVQPMIAAEVPVVTISLA